VIFPTLLSDTKKLDFASEELCSLEKQLSQLSL